MRQPFHICQQRNEISIDRLPHFQFPERRSTAEDYDEIFLTKEGTYEVADIYERNIKTIHYGLDKTVFVELVNLAPDFRQYSDSLLSKEISAPLAVGYFLKKDRPWQNTRTSIRLFVMSKKAKGMSSDDMDKPVQTTAQNPFTAFRIK